MVMAGYHLGEHGEWEKKANFELTTRVPLIIAAPHYPRSHGRNTDALIDLVDLYPTLTDLAGLPPPNAEPHLAKDSKSAVALFSDPGVAGLRTASFSQYPRCGDAGPAVEQGSCNIVDKHEFKYMGYSVRTAAWRYTAWMPWVATALSVDWKATPYAEELYDHALDDGTDFNAFENENLVAPGADHPPAVVAARTQLLAALVAQFAT